MTPLLAGLVVTFLASLLFTPAVAALARRRGIVAVPRQDRWHRAPTALLGGVAICAAFVVGFAIEQPVPARSLPVVVSAAWLFVVGLVDDVAPIRPLAKLLAQLVAAAVVVAFGLHLPWTGSVVLNDAVTVVWLVGITNATNLLDNMDGLAGGIAVIAAFFLAVTFVLNGQMEEAVLPALLAGATLGFLPFNRKPASIFMGDCGSMFIGALLGGTALLSSYGRTRNLASVLLTPVLILLIPIFDTCLVTVTRKLSGRAVSVGGRDHTSHRLVALGLSEQRAVALLYVVATLAGGFALAVRWRRDDGLLVLLPILGAVVAAFGVILGRVRVEDLRPSPTAHRDVSRA